MDSSSGESWVLCFCQSRRVNQFGSDVDWKYTGGKLTLSLSVTLSFWSSTFRGSEWHGKRQQVIMQCTSSPDHSYLCYRLSIMPWANLNQKVPHPPSSLEFFETFIMTNYFLSDSKWTFLLAQGNSRFPSSQYYYCICDKSQRQYYGTKCWM